MSQYAAISFVYNEQPATSKWNIIGTNFDYMQNALCPPGSVVFYHGNSASIPGYWMLSNGTTISDTESPINGVTTPNCVSKFIRGTTGNVVTTPVTGGADTVTLSTTNLPSHNHGITDPGHFHTINDPGHSHQIQLQTFLSATGAQPWAPVAGGTAYGSIISSSTTGISIFGSTTGITINNTGSGTAFSILPSYVGLVPIYRFK